MIRGQRAKMPMIDDYFIDTETAELRLKESDKKKIQQGCCYCNTNNYRPTDWCMSDGFDEILTIWGDLRTELCMTHNSLTNKFGIAAIDDGIATTDIDFCPKCGRDLR